MKEKEAKIDFEKHQVVIFVEKENGRYEPLQTGGCIAKEYISDYIEKLKKQEEECMEKLKKGEISPIYYYMICCNITLKDLAKRVNMMQSKVKKHLTPAGFEKVKIKELKKYADVFGIDIGNLLTFINCKEDGIETKKIKTNNQYFSMIEIRRK